MSATPLVGLPLNTRSRCLLLLLGPRERVCVVGGGVCARCHDGDRRDSPDGTYPSLVRNSAVGQRDASNLIAVLLQGVQRGGTVLPGFGATQALATTLSDAEIAAVASVVRARFGDRDAALATPANVARARSDE